MFKKIGVLVCAVFLLWQIGCSNKPTEKTSTIPEIKIGFTVYRRDDTFISTIVSSMEEAIKEGEQKKNIKIVMHTMDAKGNQTVQNDQIDKLIEQGCDVLCVNLVDRTVAATVIDKAKVADIPVVFFNREPVKEDLERWNKVYYVGAEAMESGKLEGKIVVENYYKNNGAMDKNGDGKLQYVVLEGEQGHQDALLRTEYAVKTITESGIQMDKLAGDTANWLRGQAETKMNQWLQLYDNIELILCNNDDMALGAIDAYENAGKALPAVVGIDGIAPAMEAMKEGKLLGTVKNDAKKQAELIFMLSYYLAMGENISKNMNLTKEKYIFTEYTIVSFDEMAIKD